MHWKDLANVRDRNPPPTWRPTRPSSALMIISIDLAGAATFEDVDNFRAFKVAAICGPDQLARALTGLGRLDGTGNAWISRTWLLANGRPGDAKWLAGFSAMLDYASAHGWVEPATDCIRAHVEYVSS